MLITLYIKKFALFDEIHVSFEEGLNIITGETGAGKSLIVDALNFLLGDRSDLTALRKGAPKAVVEGTFGPISGALTEFLVQNDLDVLENEVRLRRELNSSGRSRAFINDTPVTIDTLRKLGEMLVDLHGQHEHQSLLKNEKHLEYLDAFAGVEAEVLSVRESFRKIRALKNQLAELDARARVLEEKRDYLQFQLKEIQATNPQPGEEEELEREERILANSERLFSLSSETYRILYEEDQSIYSLLTRVENLLVELQQIDEQFSDSARLSSEAKINLDEVAKFLQQYTATFEFNPERLEEIRTRLSELRRLEKKYGPNISAVLEKKEKIEAELGLLENIDSEIESTRAELAAEKERYTRLALELSEKRRAAAKRLKKSIEQVLKKLGMERAVFEVAVEPLENPQGWVSGEKGKRLSATARGVDRVTFLISANPGEPLKELQKVASGGEISRIMLAIKSVLSEKDAVPVLVFDEIDSGISGRVAQTVGKQLKELSDSHQIICVTHLPQIASAGRRHFAVEKAVQNNETRTFIRPLSDGERIVEIAKLIGGERVTDVNLRSAEELLKDFNGHEN